MARTEEHKKKSIRYMIVSIIIAIAIWSVVTYMTDSEITKTLHNVEVRFTGLSELKSKSLIVKGIDGKHDFTVRFNGRRSEIISAIDSAYIEVDVSKIQNAGVQELDGTVMLNNLDLRVLKAQNKNIPVIVEPFDKKELEITVRKINSDSSRPIKSVPQKNTVIIYGARSDINNVGSAYVSVDDSQINASSESEYQVCLADKSGETIEDLGTIETGIQKITVVNTVYEPAEVTVVPKLSEELSREHRLDEEKTEVKPSKLKVGVLPGSSFETVTAIIDTDDGEETECEIEIPEGMYIPKESAKVKVKASFIQEGGEGAAASDG